MIMVSKTVKEIIEILLAIVILSISFSFRNMEEFGTFYIFFLIIIAVNVIAKKIVGYIYETEVRNSIWSINRIKYNRVDTKKNTSMVWLPLFVSVISLGYFQWLPLLVFNVEPKPERASKRHGNYRFSEVTEWHLAFIVLWGIIANVILASASYFLGFEKLAKLSIYYVVYSIIPLSNLDGSKLFFGNRKVWTMTSIISIILLLITFTF